MKALIFAAGLGTRLRPITDRIPKALVPVAGVPMLERVIRKLQSDGIDEFVINVHHHADQICDFLRRNSDFGAEIRISAEPDAPLETGGGIRHARPFLEDEPFLVHNSDILCRLDLPVLLDGVRPDALATLLVQEAESDRYLLFDDDMRLRGWTNVLTGQVKSPFPDFNASDCHRYSFCGIHLISNAVFPLMESWPDTFGIMDFYLDVAARHPIYGVVGKDLNLVDIGSPEKLELAGRIYGSTI